MAFSSFLNMGNSYDKEKNYFNALVSYETAISKDHLMTEGLHNIGLTLQKVGLQKQALHNFNRAIKYYENNRNKKNDQPWKIYSNRAGLIAILNKSDLLNLDIERALSLKPDYSNSLVIKGKFEIFNGRIQDGIESFNKAIDVENMKPYCWRDRAQMFEVLGQYENAISDYSKAIELSKNPTRLFYELGRVQFLLGDIENAKINFQQFISKSLWDFPYSLPNTNIGIVQFIDKQKGFGFIFGSTWFNSFDCIFFKLSNCRKTPKKGERVRFALKYKSHGGKYTANAEQIESHSSFDTLQDKNKTTFHCIIHNKQNAFKASSDLKYLHIFYPYETFYPFSLVENKLDENLKKSFFNDGYVFAEASILLLDNNIPEIITLNPIEPINSFANKFFAKPTYEFRRRSSDYSTDSFWTCSVCDGDNETGCRMSDPQNCPKGRGI